MKKILFTITIGLAASVYFATALPKSQTPIAFKGDPSAPPPLCPPICGQK